MSVELNPIPSVNFTADKPKANATTKSDFSSVMRTTQEIVTDEKPKSRLTTAEDALANRPSIKEFMDLTGVNFLTASDLIYGVIGSNTDIRNWSVILSEQDPVTALRKATGEQYGLVTPIIEPAEKVIDINKATNNEQTKEQSTYITPETTIQVNGNFALYQEKEVIPATDKTEQIVTIKAQGLKLIDANGKILRDAGHTAEQIEHNAWLFGFDTQELSTFATPAKELSEQLSDAIDLVLNKSNSKPTSSVDILLEQINWQLS